MVTFRNMSPAIKVSFWCIKLKDHPSPLVSLSVQMSGKPNSFLTNELILMKLYTVAVYNLMHDER